MKRQAYSFKFFLNIRKRNQKGFPIYLRIIIDQKKIEHSTKNFVKNVADWDEQTQRVKTINSFINKNLNLISAEIENIIHSLLLSKKKISAKLVKELYLNKDSDIKLIDFVQTYITREITAERGFAEGTIKNYRATFNHISNYLEKSESLNFHINDLSEEFIDEFDQYLHNDSYIPVHPDLPEKKPLKRNTCNKYHLKFQSILDKAVSEKLIDRNPYSEKSFRHEATSRTFLNHDELDRIIHHSLGGNPSLIRVRDIFLFSVFSGLRWASAISIKKENLECDSKKDYWLNFMQKGSRQQSGPRKLRLPLLNKAKEILDKYKHEREITGYLLPRISNQKFNVYLKIIGELADIDKNLSHHVARHTAATKWLSEDLPLEIVGALLGNSDIKSTQIYAKVTNERLRAIADKLNNKWK